MYIGMPATNSSSRCVIKSIFQQMCVECLVWARCCSREINPGKEKESQRAVTLGGVVREVSLNRWDFSRDLNEEREREPSKYLGKRVSRQGKGKLRGRPTWAWDTWSSHKVVMIVVEGARKGWALRGLVTHWCALCTPPKGLSTKSQGQESPGEVLKEPYGEEIGVAQGWKTASTGRWLQSVGVLETMVLGPGWKQWEAKMGSDLMHILKLEPIRFAVAWLWKVRESSWERIKL